MVSRVLSTVPGMGGRALLASFCTRGNQLGAVSLESEQGGRAGAGLGAALVSPEPHPSAPTVRAGSSSSLPSTPAGPPPPAPSALTTWPRRAHSEPAAGAGLWFASASSRGQSRARLWPLLLVAAGGGGELGAGETEARNGGGGTWLLLFTCPGFPSGPAIRFQLLKELPCPPGSQPAVGSATLPACSRPAWSPRKADKSQLPSQRARQADTRRRDAGPRLAGQLPEGPRRAPLPLPGARAPFRNGFPMR